MTDTIEKIMAHTGMGELQAYRHLQGRRKVQALYEADRRKQVREACSVHQTFHTLPKTLKKPLTAQENANEALRLWQEARMSARSGHVDMARAQYHECLEILK